MVEQKGINFTLMTKKKIAKKSLPNKKLFMLSLLETALAFRHFRAPQL
jgi:hypothetical protein